MIIGIVSDTHGHAAYTQLAVRMLESCQAEAVIHCGDIGSAEIVEWFRPWPTHYVFGNCDSDYAELRAAIADAGHTCHERFGALEFEGRKIAFLHGDDTRLWQKTISEGQYDLVCYGHTHVPEQHREGPSIVLNPGALYRANPHTIAICRLPELEITHVKL